NIGNTYFKQDKLQESIESYITSLNLKPDDNDAKYNLELARAKLKELADKQQQQPQQNQQQQQGEQQKESGKDEESEKENQQQQEQQQGEQQNEEQQEEQQGQQLEEDKDQMSKEDAERILEALKNDEQDNQKLRKPKKGGRRSVAKDW
ncbi:MAG: tetratricopeptide repeat protein, partial [Calditrichia bacterium]|nr:tetratricopeptide repeat protein [Calditrichia bacterium]